MKTLLSLLLLALPLPSLAMEGTATVKSGSWRVQREDDGMKVNFYPGRYKTTLDFGRGILHFAVERNGITTRAQLKVPAGASLPDNGPISIDGFRTGQTFAARGDIQTVRANTPEESGSESCVYYRDEWICRGHGRWRECGWERIPTQGYQRVRYYFETKTVTLRLALDSRNGGDASFDGNSRSSKKIYTYQGACY